MDLYKDEVAFWDEFVLRYLHREYSGLASLDYLTGAAYLADQMILERRKRNVVED